MSANLASNALRALARTAVRSAPAARPSLRVLAPSSAFVKPTVPAFSCRSFTQSAHRRAEDDLPVATPPSEGEGQKSFPIFVGNVPYAANSTWLRTLFKQFGEVDDARMIMTDGRSRGFGFVHFRTSEGRESALRMDGREVEGRVLVVSESTSARNNNERGPLTLDGPRPEGPRSAFLVIDQISPTTRMSEILSILRDRGLPEPISSRMIVDRRTGLGKGHAYLDFAGANEAEQVLRAMRDDPIVTGEPLEGQQEGEDRKSLGVAYARPKRQDREGFQRRDAPRSY